MANFGFDKLLSRRKSAGTAIEDAQNGHSVSPEPSGTSSDHSSGFRVMSQREAEDARIARKAAEQRKSDKPKLMGRLSGGRPFSSPAQKGVRQHSFEDDSGASNRQSNASSSSTHFSSSKPYPAHNAWGQYGDSNSTLYSTGDGDSDNMFANLPPPEVPPKPVHSHTYSMSGTKKARTYFSGQRSSGYEDGFEVPQGHEYRDELARGPRTRAMTTSSYASTAIPPRVDAELSLGTSDFGSSFDDMFSGLNKKQSPPRNMPAIPATPGRSLLANHRYYQPEPIQIDKSLSIDPSPKSWESRNSDDALIAASPPELDSPPPVPPHTAKPQPKAPNGQEYQSVSNPAAMRSSSSFEDEDAKLVRQSFATRRSLLASSPETKPNSTSSSSAISHQIPLSSRSTSNTTTPKALSRIPVNDSDDEDGGENMFADRKKQPETRPAALRVPAPAVQGEEEDEPLFDTSTIAAAAAARNFTENGPVRKIMTQAEFKQQKQMASTQPVDDDSDEESAYEDEDEAEAIKKQQELRRKQERQLAMNRELMRRTTAPNDPNRPSSSSGTPLTGYPSEMFINKPDDDEDDDIPLGILQAHGFPNHSRPPTKPTDAAPSYFRSSSMGMPERPASAGALGPRASTANLPAFARGLPMDPFIGASLVRPSNRESLGLGGHASMAGSVYGDSAPRVPAGGLVGVIQEEERAKKIRRGHGATSTYGYGSTFGQQQMPQMHQQAAEASDKQMMMNLQMQIMQQNAIMQQMMSGGQMGNGMMPGMSPGGMMGPQMNQDFAAEVARQMMSMQVNGQPQNMGGMNGMQMPQMSLPQVNIPQQQGFLSPNGPPVGRPMSISSNVTGTRRTSTMGNLAPPMSHRPFSAPMNGFSAPPQNGYTPSIAPSERSNVGLSARYRPVVTNQPDGVSSVSSHTAQGPTPGVTDTSSKRATIKGILKPGHKEKENREDGEWQSLSNRRSKWLGNRNITKSNEPTLQDLYEGMEGVGH